MSTRCPQCGTDNQDNAKFCNECGYRFPQQMTCPDCGAPVEPGVKFCSNCGHSFVAAAPAPSPAPAKPSPQQPIQPAAPMAAERPAEPVAEKPRKGLFSKFGKKEKETDPQSIDTEFVDADQFFKQVAIERQQAPSSAEMNTTPAPPQQPENTSSQPSQTQTRSLQQDDHYIPQSKPGQPVSQQPIAPQQSPSSYAPNQFA